MPLVQGKLFFIGGYPLFVSLVQLKIILPNFEDNEAIAAPHCILAGISRVGYASAFHLDGPPV